MGSLTGQSSIRTRRTGQQDSIQPILTPKNDVVAGQVIVQLSGDASAAITESIAGNSSAFVAPATATSFGVSAIDQALAGLKVTSISRLHPPAPQIANGEMALAAEVLSSTFRVHYDAKTAPEKVVANLGSIAGVEFAEAVRLRETLSTTPNDPQFPSQWGLRRIHCPDAWDRTRGSSSIVVAVVDTGVDLDHPELAPLLVQGRDFVNLGPSPTPPPGFHYEGDFNIVDDDPMDEVGHGTHVAGTICCLSNNAAGVAGVTWDCRVMPVRVLARIVNNANPSDVRGTGSSADIAAGIRWAVDHGARVINLSLGGPSDTFVERDAIAYAIAHNVVVCAAMGNGGTGAPVSYPGAYPDVVAVGAIDSSDHRASFSQVGPHIDVVGPGVNVLSTVWNNSFATMSGTSMATPHVAGVAALILSIKPSLTAAQCADILRQTADPLRDNPPDPIPNNNYGWGCVNALGAINRASPPLTTTVICHASAAIICHNTSPIVCPVQTTPITCPPHTTQVGCTTSPIVCHVSNAITCQTQPIHCPHTVLTCPAPTVVACPPTAVACPPHTLLTCPAPTVVACPHTAVACPPHTLLTCPAPTIVCPQTHNFPCQISQTISCPSLTVCPSGFICPSAICPQTLACGGGPGPIAGGGGGMGSSLGGDDPYSADYGS